MGLAWRKTAVRRRVVVNLKTGNSVSGILWAQRGPLLVLRNGQLFEKGVSEPAKVDGEIVVQISNIDFIQVIPEG